MTNPNNLKKGDIILVEEAWEDDAGSYHDETAEILDISDDGELKLKWLCRKDLAKFLDGSDSYYAKDFSTETI